MQTLPGRPMRITNARPLTTDLDREGFVLVQHASSIADFGQIEEDPEVDQRYVAEMTDLLAEVTGAQTESSCWAGERSATARPRRGALTAAERQAGALSAR